MNKTEDKPISAKIDWGNKYKGILAGTLTLEEIDEQLKKNKRGMEIG